MCFLNLKKPELKRAEKDIKVYKVINKNGLGWLFSLQIGGIVCPWEKGFHYTEKDFVKKALSGDLRYTYRVHGDAFHSVKRKIDAEAMRGEDEKIVVMYIPKNGYYYENEEEYVSSDLVWY